MYRLRSNPIDTYEKDEQDKIVLSDFLRGYLSEEKIHETALRVFFRVIAPMKRKMRRNFS